MFCSAFLVFRTASVTRSLKAGSFSPSTATLSSLRMSRGRVDVVYVVLDGLTQKLFEVARCVGNDSLNSEWCEAKKASSLNLLLIMLLRRRSEPLPCNSMGS